MSEQLATELTYRETAREKLPIFFGSFENFMHSLREICMNGTDEMEENFPSGKLFVKLDNDLRTLSIRDTGRGMILFTKNKTGKLNYVSLLEVLYAGGKYKVEEGKRTTGQNGVGLTVTNYTSEYFRVDSYHDDKRETVVYENGGNLVSKETVNAKGEEHGTCITWRLDPEVYTNTIFQPEEIADYLERLNMIAPKITITYVSPLGEKIYNSEGMHQYYKEKVYDGTSDVLIVEDYAKKEIPGQSLEYRVILGTSITTVQESYLNKNYLVKGGKIDDGIIEGVRKFANEYCSQNDLMPKNIKNFKAKDIQESISYIADVYSTNASFSGQTKFDTDCEEYYNVMAEYIELLLWSFVDEKPRVIKEMIDHIITIAKGNYNSEASRRKLTSVLKPKSKKNNKPEKLTDCYTSGDNAEIYIAEGDSAGTGFVDARDSDFQAVFTGKGKFGNVLKLPVDKIMKNEVIIGLYQALGCGMDMKGVDCFDIKDLKYGKIILGYDADDDGYHIGCMYVALLWTYSRKLILEKKVYIACTPLYIVRTKSGETIYIYSESEKDKILQGINEPYEMHRNKGIGELQSEELSRTAMNPETRKLIRLNVKDPKAFDEMLEQWMGKDTAYRKDFIQEHIREYLEM